MNNNSLPFEEISFDAVIPSALLFNENIEPSAIKLYAFIRGLTRVHGYCYATNDYLSKCMKCDVSTVKRLLRSLAAEGFIEIETDKTGIHWVRRIYIAHDLKLCLRKLEKEPSKGLNQTPPCLKMSHNRRYRKEDIEKNTYKKSAPPPPSAEASDLCKFFFEKIKERNPKFKEPKLTAWEKEFDLILTLDKRTPQELKVLIEWVHTHSFWKANILAPASLRKHYDKLLMQIQAEADQYREDKNRKWALAQKKKYPEQLKSLTISPKYAINLGTSKEIPFSLPELTFKNALFNMFGGKYVPGRDSDMESTE